MKKLISQIIKFLPNKNKEPKLTGEQKEELLQHVRQAFQHDQADYDGMGNWGRFPPPRKDK